jgi:hypothetical protein
MKVWQALSLSVLRVSSSRIETLSFVSVRVLRQKVMKPAVAAGSQVRLISKNSRHSRRQSGHLLEPVRVLTSWKTASVWAVGLASIAISNAWAMIQTVFAMVMANANSRKNCSRQPAIAVSAGWEKIALSNVHNTTTSHVGDFMRAIATNIQCGVHPASARTLSVGRNVSLCARVHLMVSHARDTANVQLMRKKPKQAVPVGRDSLVTHATKSVLYTMGVYVAAMEGVNWTSLERQNANVKRDVMETLAK